MEYKINNGILISEGFEIDEPQWTISFDGHIPSPEHKFEMVDGETAHRLRDYLINSGAIKNYTPPK